MLDATLVLFLRIGILEINRLIDKQIFLHIFK